MEKDRKALIGYIVLVFVLMPVASFFPLEAAALYLQVALIIMGVTAIILQKWVHRGRFVDMGFRLNRDALAGLGVGLAYTIVMLALGYGLPLGLNLIEVTANRGSSMVDQGGLSLQRVSHRSWSAASSCSSLPSLPKNWSGGGTYCPSWRISWVD